MIEAVIFDMDGLLIDSEPLWRIAEKKVFATVDIPLDDSDFDHFMGFKINEVVDYWYGKHPWTTKSKLDLENEILDELEALIRAQGTVMTGVMTLLDFFKNKNVSMAIASSSPHSIIQVVVNKLNIKNYFKIIHSAEMEKYGKPHPAVYISTAKLLNVIEPHCLVLEDSFNGLISAKAARMKTISVPDAKQFNQSRFDIADIKLTSLSDFTETHWQLLNKK